MYKCLPKGSEMRADQGLMPEEMRENLRTAQRERWRKVKLFDPIRQAAEAGNERLAVRLLREYIRNQKAAA